MRKKNKEFLFKVSKYLPMLIILIAVTIMVGSTFAYFTDKKDAESDLTFSKVELGSETTTGINGELRDVIPGSKLIDGPVSFSKSIDSEAIYVRAKISFSLPREYLADDKMQEIVNELRSAADFNIDTTEQNGAVWSGRQGNYYYLMEAVDEGTPTKLMRVDTIDTYVLSDEIVIPRDLEQLEGNYQYMKGINFHLAFEAIQADNVSDELDDTKEVFDNLFPINDSEAGYSTLVFNYDGKIEYVTTQLGDVVKAPVVSKAGHTFDGWFTRDGSESGDWGEMVTLPLVVNDSIELFAKFTLTPSTGLEFTEIKLNNEIIGYSVSEGECLDKYIVIPETYNDVPVISVGSFYNENITGVYLPDTITSIKMDAFLWASNLSSINLPESLITIGQRAFCNCFKLTSITLPSSLQQIQANAFANCFKLIEMVNKSSIDIQVGDDIAVNALNVIRDETESKIKIQGDYKFYDDGIGNVYLIEYIGNDTKIVLPDSYNGDEYTIYKYALYGSNLVSVIFPEFITELPDSVLASNYKLSTVKLPENLQIIGDLVFNKCYSLYSFTIPSNISYINFSAFSNCYKLAEVINLSNLEIDRANTPNLSLYTLQVVTRIEDSKIVKIDDFIFYENHNNKNYLLGSLSENINLELPSNYNGQTYEIYKYAFYKYDIYENIVIPEPITTIGQFAFYDCYNLNLTIPKTINSIQDNAFYNIKNLKFNGNIAEWRLQTTGGIFNSDGTGADNNSTIFIEANDGVIEYKQDGETGCLIEGTMITLANGDKKAIEDITFDDLLLIWNYDLGCFDYAYPIWIEKAAMTTSYTEVTLANGSVIGAVDEHGIFNADLNKFVNMCEISDEFYVGCNVVVYGEDDNGNMILTQSMVTKIETVYEKVNYYQVSTTNYYNVFANDILTVEGNVYLSNRYGFNNNVKWDSELRRYAIENGYPYEEFSDIIDYYLFIGLAVNEGKFLVDLGYLTEEEFRFFVINEVANMDDLISPNIVIKDGVQCRVWSVTTSTAGNISNPVKVVESEMFVLPDAQMMDGKTFIGWRSSADGKIYNSGDSVVIWFGTHFTAIYE